MLAAGMLSCGGRSTTRLDAQGDGMSGQQPVPAANKDVGENPGATAKTSSTAPDLMDEEDAWDIVSFTDPRDSSVYDIVDGRVIIALKNQPVLPTEDEHYFDEELSEEDSYLVDFAELVPANYDDDTDVQDFVTAEDVTIYAEWPEVGGLAVQLPEGTSVEDAISDWPTEYSDLIDVVDADAVCVSNAWPSTGDPNDYRFPDQWAVSDTTYASVHSVTNDYHINLQTAWHNDQSYSFGSNSKYVAVIDSGVDYNSTYLPDLSTNSSSLGCNVGDKRASTTFIARSSGGGRTWQFLLDESADNAFYLGHGTCVAGIISAAINNDPPIRTLNNGKGIAGAGGNTKYFPITMKERSTGFTTSVYLNAFTALGCVKQVYDPKVLYGQSTNCPKYNIVVANCSWGNGSPGLGSEVGLRHLRALTPYILFVCSSGNNNSNSSSYFPANFDANVSVCNYSISGYRSGGNYDSTVDIAAPGSDILTLDMVGTNTYGQQLGFSSTPYASFGGTSAATPHVAAIAAVISAIDMDSGSPVTLPTAAQIRAALIFTKGNLPDSQLSTIKRMDAASAIAYLEP